MNVEPASTLTRRAFNDGDTMRPILILALGLFVSPALAATPLSSTDARDLIKEERAANEICRSVDGVRQTEIACERRSAYTMRLNEIGWCFGKEGQGGAEMTWHRCGPTSYHYGD